MRGGEEVFIIGKNFLKGTKVIFQENIAGTVAVVGVVLSIYTGGYMCLHLSLLVDGRIKRYFCSICR